MPSWRCLKKHLTVRILVDVQPMPLILFSTQPSKQGVFS